jgi:hypothetical protein
MVGTLTLVALAAGVPVSAHWTVPGLGSHTAAVGGSHWQARSDYTRRARSVAADGSLGAHGCTLVTDPAGNATGTLSTAVGNIDSLDVTALGFSTDAKAGTLSALIKVVSLTDGPNGGPTMDGIAEQWIVTLQTPAGDQYSLIALYGVAGSYSDGTAGPEGIWVPSPSSNLQLMTSFVWGDKANPVIGQGTGALDGTTNVVSITVPLAALKLKAGDAVVGVSVDTQAIAAGSVVYPDYAYAYEHLNTVNAQNDAGDDIPYKIGKAC